MRRLIAAALTVAALNLPAPTVEASSRRCPQWEPALRKYAPTTGWDVGHMSYLMWRESRCLPHVESATSDVGLLQVNQINRTYLAMRFHLPTARWWFVKQWLKDPLHNIQAASVLSKFAARAWGDRYRPWQVRR